MTTKPTPKLFAIKTTGGQEKTVADFLSNRVKMKKLPIYSALVIENMKGYVFLEADNAQVVNDGITGFKNVRGQVPGIVQYSDIDKFLTTKPVILELDINDLVEIIAGPFKGMKARIKRIEPSRSEVTIILLDAPYPLPVTVDSNYLKLVSKEKQSS